MITPRTPTLALFALLAGAAPVHAAALPPRIAQVLHNQGFPASAVSIVVRDPTRAETLLELNPDVPRAPASTIKVLTTYAALARLGPVFHWTTRAWTSAPVVDGTLAGDLVIEGGGDPAMSAERWWRFAQELRNRGLRRIEGDLVLDRSRYEDQDADVDEFDGRGWRTYNVLPDALLVNLQAADFHVVAERGHARVRVDPEPANLQVEDAVQVGSGPCTQSLRPLSFSTPSGDPDRIRIEGRVAPGCPAEARRVIMRAPDFAYGTFLTYWRELGGEFNGALRLARRPAGARLYAEFESLPLAEVIRLVNKHSSNAMARTLLLTLAAERGEAPATVAGGERAIADWLASQGLTLPGLVLDNGSGLSRRARITAGGMAAVLNAARASPWWPELAASVPIGGVDGTLHHRFVDLAQEGRIRMKTGHLGDVGAIAGWVTARSGRQLSVVVMINHPGAEFGGGEAVIDTIVRWAIDR
jgi:D-alanyl-D-alanine carboxypeptidase/D-alanyl-D-alanine-endopeptidase (penicillin-binding protein 4)